MRLSEMGFDDRFIEILGKDFELYPHQEEAILKLRQNRNLLVTVPTAAGKTLIAYAAIMSNIKAGKRSLYIVPLKALAFEKFSELKTLRKHGYRIAIATGDFDSSASFIRNYDVVVCTAEKADSMIRHDPSILFDIGLIIADEAHMVGEPDRGPRLETVLTATRIVNPDTQILALSATISNPGEVCEWLDSNIVVSDFRPVNLRKGVLYQNKIFYYDGTVIDTNSKDIFGVLIRVLEEGGQTLIFVNSRKKSEELAEKISIFLKDNGYLRDETIEAEDDPYGERINSLIRTGVSFHHAGLSTNIRNQVEMLFKERRISTIVATPTLAAGVNLPARCVIVRDITRYQDGRSVYLSAREIFQMLGRAGRPGLDPYGEALIYAASPQSYEHAQDYMEMEVEPTMSSAGSQKHIRMNSLALVAMGIGKTQEEIMEFYSKMLFAFQNPISNITEKVQNSIGFLKENDLVNERSGKLFVTKLGKVASDLYLDPESAIILHDYLKEKHSENLALFRIAQCPDMMRLNPGRDDIQSCEYFLDNLGVNDYDEESFSSAKTAMVLKEWISETPMRAIMDQYRIGPGDVQALSSSADWISYSLAVLANSFKPEIKEDLYNLNFRIKEGVKEDIIPLTMIAGVGRVRARRLYSNGFIDLERIASAEIPAIKKIYGFSDKLARDVITSAKSIVKRTG
ncbi:MAG: DEAD/DEAH box helicase [Thermoplasmataceae archaeon]|jgi:helicase